jgi:hypothetical protein
MKQAFVMPSLRTVHKRSILIGRSCPSLSASLYPAECFNKQTTKRVPIKLGKQGLH